MSRAIKQGSTNQSTTLRFVDSGDGTPETGVVAATAGLDLYYRIEGGLRVQIGSLSDLAALDTAHTDGGLKHVGNGYYRVDVPDAAFASGTGVLIEGTATGMVVIGAYHPLVAYDPSDAVRLGLTALPNAAAEAAGGLFTRGTGAGQINQDANGRIDANQAAISGDSTAADNLETMLDGTGGQTLTLGQLRINSSAAGGGIDIDNSAGPAISAQSSAADALSLVSTGADGHGFYAAGNGGGDGLHALGGATGHGIHGTGGSTSGHGMRVTAPTEGDGLEAAGAGAGKDIDADLSGSVASVVGTVTVGTNNDKTGYALSSASLQAIWEYATRTLTAISDSSGVTTLLTRITGAVLLASGYTAPDNAGISTAATQATAANTAAGAVQTVLSGITNLAQWLGLIAGKQTGNTTARTELRATGAGSGTYDETTDSLEAIKDTASAPSAAAIADAVCDEALSGHTTPGTVGAALTSAATGGSITITYSQVALALAAAVDAGTITIRRGDRLSLQVTGLGTLPAGRDKLWFTVKKSASLTDAQALIQITETGGLLRFKGAVATDNGLTTADGSLTVDDATDGDVTVVLSAAAAALLSEAGRFVYDFQYQDGSTVTTLAQGVALVTFDVTRATS